MRFIPGYIHQGTTVLLKLTVCVFGLIKRNNIFKLKNKLTLTFKHSALKQNLIFFS